MRSRLAISATALLATTTLAGCASMTHFNKERSTGTQKTFFVDAKQRAIFTVQREERKGTLTTRWSGVCAEPSPDAISALAAALGVDLTLTDKGKLGVSHSVAEGVTSLGVRTAAIEALRDIMYRNCEAFALGGISDIGLETLQRRFQTNMVAILAIEQLSGTVRAPGVTLGGTSSTGSADAIVDLTDKTEAARKALDDARAAEATAKEKSESDERALEETRKKLAEGEAEADRIGGLPSPNDAEKAILAEYDALSKTQAIQTNAAAASKTVYVTASATTKARQQAFDALEAARAAAVAATGEAGVAGQLEAVPARQPLSDKAAEALAKAVVSIVATTVERQFGPELCTTLLGHYSNQKPEDGSALAVCLTLLKRNSVIAGAEGSP